MSDIKITDLPDEILEKIFLNFPFWDDSIFNVIRVCKKFEDVISNSVKLMENFTIHWRGNKLKDTRVLMESKRKYRKISLQRVYRIKDSLLKVLENNTFMLTDLHLYKCALQTSEFGILLQQVAENLDCISMCCVNFVEDQDAFPIYFPKLNWIELMYSGGQGYQVIVDFFKGSSSVKILSFEDNQEGFIDSDIKRFCDFIGSLCSLEDLSLSNDLVQAVFEDGYFTKSCQYLKLKKFHLWINQPEHRGPPTASVRHYNNLLEFIECQKESLDDLTLVRCVVNTGFIQRLLKLNVVRSLTIILSQFNIYQRFYVQNTSITELKLGCSQEATLDFEDIEDSDVETGVCDILKSCQNLVRLEFIRLSISFEISITINNHLKNLREMELNYCDVPPFTYENVISMDLSMKENDIIKLLRVNKQLKHVKIPSRVQYNQKYSVALSELHQLESIEFE